jgi:hypothetical protein
MEQKLVFGIPTDGGIHELGWRLFITSPRPVQREEGPVPVEEESIENTPVMTDSDSREQNGKAHTQYRPVRRGRCSVSKGSGVLWLRELKSGRE